MNSEMNLAKIGIKWLLFSILTAIISFIGIVYFSRVLGAQTLGIYFLFFSVLTIFNLFTNMGLNPATIKRISERNQKSEIATASLILRLCVFGFCTLLILVFQNQLNLYTGADLSYYLFFILGLTQFSDIIKEILHGEQKVDIGGAYDLIQQTLRVAFQSFLIFIGIGILGLIFGLGIGILVSILIGLKLVSLRLKTPDKSHYKSLLTFSKFSFGNAIGGYIYEWADIVIIGFFLSQQYVGIYGIAWGLSAVFLLLSHAIASSIYPKISELSSRNEKQKISEIFSEGLIYSPLIVIPVFFGTLVISEDLLETIYGDEFKNGYLVLIIVMLARVFQSAQIISVRTLEGMNLPNLVFKVNIVTTIINVFGTFLLIYLFGFVGAAIGTTLTIFVSFLWNTHTVYGMLNVKIPLWDIVLQVLSAAIMGLAVFAFSKLLLLTELSNLILTILVGGAIYFITLFSLSKRIKSKCLLMLKEMTHGNRRMVAT